MEPGLEQCYLSTVSGQVMEQLLVYADSLSWGIIPTSRERLPFARRWPGVLETELGDAGEDIRVIENCLNGRRTVWDDPFKAGRNGAEGLAQVIEMHSPLRAVLLMLGSNDFQVPHTNNAWSCAQGVARLINIIREAPIEPGMPIPQILVVAPPPLSAPRGPIAPKFQGARERSAGLAEELARVCGEQDTAFFDAGSIVETSPEDGIHLDVEQHQVLGNALVDPVMRLLTL